MSFFEERLPERYSFGAKGGPAFSTEVNKTQGGQRFANKNWTYPLNRYDVSSSIKTQADFEVFRSFFYVVSGQFDGFRFKDWSDYQSGAGEVHPIPQPLSLITGSVYQLNVTYTRGARTFTRPIFKPVSAIVVYRTRSAVTSVISPSIDYTTGQVTVSGHVAGDTYTWSGEFDVPVAFTSDVMEIEIANKSDGQFAMTWPTIQVEEIRL